MSHVKVIWIRELYQKQAFIISLLVVLPFSYNDTVFYLVIDVNMKLKKYINRDFLKLKKGFSIPGIVLGSLVVVALLVFAIPMAKKHMSRAEQVTCQANMQTLNKEIAMYIETENKIPSLSDLENKDIHCPNSGIYEIKLSESKNKYPHVECLMHSNSNFSTTDESE